MVMYEPVAAGGTVALLDKRPDLVVLSPAGATPSSITLSFFRLRGVRYMRFSCRE